MCLVFGLFVTYGRRNVFSLIPEDVKCHKLEDRICNRRLVTSITTVNLLLLAAIVELSGKKVAKPSHVPFSDCKLRWPTDDSELHHHLLDLIRAS